MKKSYIKIYGENGEFNVKMQGNAKETFRLSVTGIYSILDTYRKYGQYKGIDFEQLVLGVLTLDGSNVEKFAESLLAEYKDFEKFQEKSKEGGVKND